jgi:serine/threonine-protein kinase PknG
VVPPAPEIDPAKAILANPVVPEDRRVCPKCGARVGQSDDGSDGRSEGFCPSCGAPYSFTVKLKAGDLVAGQYRVQGALAHGGMGWIYLARDENVSQRWVVLKGLLNSGDSDALAAAISESQFLARVGAHPLIVEIYNFVTHGDAGYIVMEYVGGRSLKQLLQQRRTANHGAPDPLPPDQALAYLIEILPAIGYMHQLGLLYCDFKPDNVIQTGDNLKLIDLGGVRLIGDNDSPIFGTVGYQAPEVATSGPSVASDIFTIGRTLMVLCADVPGYQSDYEVTLPPADSAPVFADNDSLYRLLQRCCAADPDDRFTSVDELRAQMLGVLREVVGQGGRVAQTAGVSDYFHSPTAIGERATWQILPQLRLRPDDPKLQAVLDIADPAQRLSGLAGLAKTVEATVASGVAHVQTGDLKAAAADAGSLLAADPWEWRALWISGLAAMASSNYSQAQAAFNSVYGQLPGELAPKLALALACEQSEPALAERLYLTCAGADANYASAAAFGVARVRARAGRWRETVEALELVPATSRGYGEAQRLRAHFLVTNVEPDNLDAALKTLDQANFDKATKTSYEAALLEKALAANPRSAQASALRQRLEAAWRELAAASSDPAQRAQYVDKANAIRPWSLL